MSELDVHTISTFIAPFSSAELTFKGQNPLIKKGIG